MRDQAEGLRRLFGGRRAIVEVAAGAPGAGGSMVVAHPVGALPEASREMLVFDCTPSANAASVPGVYARFDLADAMSRERELGEVIAPGSLIQDILLVVSPEAVAITGGYTLIKRLASSRERRRFRLLVARARSEEQALKIFRNMACATRRYLRTELDFSGWALEDIR